jgi:hypothetical protein
MPSSDPTKHSAAQQVRLRFIDFRLFFAGRIGRTDLMDRFGIADAAASRDLALYREACPEFLDYDTHRRDYFITEKYQRTFIAEEKAVHLLRALIHGMGDDFGGAKSPLIPCELPSRLHRPNIDIVGAISRAIHAGVAVEIDYLSRKSIKTRTIVPFSLAGNGLRWHVRAYDRLRKRFGDFVINRVENVRPSNEPKPLPAEVKDRDKQWNRIVDLEIVPHPKLNSKRFVEVEHGMSKGVLHHEVRAAMAGYVLRLWNIDCTSDASLRGDDFGHEYQLWLRNRLALYGVENMEIAPGFQPIK